MAKTNYWKNREIIQREQLLDKTINELSKVLARDYKATLERLRISIVDTYLTILKDVGDKGEVLVSHLYQFKKYYELINKIQVELTSLGIKEERAIDTYLTSYYKENASLVDDSIGLQSDIPEEDVKAVVNSIWTADGKNWSDRIWTNKNLLAEELRQGLVDVIATGRGHKEISKMISEKFETSFSNAERLVRTELSYLQNKSTYDRYLKAGITKYRFLTAENEVEKYNANHDKEHQKGKVCIVCTELNNKVFLMSEKAVGINFPPIHPNCRCTILAVIE